MSKGWVGLKLKIYLLNTRTETTFMTVNRETNRGFHILTYFHFAEGGVSDKRLPLKKKRDDGNSK